MILTRKFLTVLFAAFFLSFTIVAWQEWKIGDNYSIKFDGKYAHGSFSKLNGTIQFDPLNPAESKFDVNVDVSSIDTGIELKNKHAKSEKWFDAERFPVIHFKSAGVAKLDSGFVVTGELDMHGITKPVSIPFHFSKTEEKAVFTGKFKVNRADFGIGKSTGKESDSTSVEIVVPVSAF